MNAHHRSFFDRPEGRPFYDALTRDDILPQYELLSRIELPAVQAVVWDLDPLLESLDPKTRQFATQSSGALIGDLLTARGFRIARGPNGEKRRGRVRKSRFVKSGTLWERTEGPSATDDAKVASIVDDLMRRYGSTLEALAR